MTTIYHTRLYRTWLQNRVTSPSTSPANLERDFLMQELSLTSPQHNVVMWKQWFTLQGQPEGSTADRWYAYLGGLGYTGSLRTRQRKFWEAG